MWSSKFKVESIFWNQGSSEIYEKKKLLHAIAKNCQHHRWSQTLIYKKILDLQLLFLFLKDSCLDCSDRTQGTENESLVRTDIFSWLAAESAQPFHWKKLKTMRKLISAQTSCAWTRLWSDPSALESDYDQTQVRSKRLWSNPNATETAYDQTFQAKVTFDQTISRPWSR